MTAKNSKLRGVEHASMIVPGVRFQVVGKQREKRSQVKKFQIFALSRSGAN